MFFAHGNSPSGVAMSLTDHGSIVKVQFFAKKSNLLADCTKPTLDMWKFIFSREKYHNLHTTVWWTEVKQALLTEEDSTGQVINPIY
jgi:hypothetical protein